MAANNLGQSYIMHPLCWLAGVMTHEQKKTQGRQTDARVMGGNFEQLLCFVDCCDDWTSPDTDFITVS